MNELQPPDNQKAPSIEGVEILSVAGVGGMSIVYKARQVAFSRIVAIKMLHAHLVASGANLQRFIQEARLATTLNHPNVARIFACGTTESEQPFLVMEFLEGASLKSLIDETGALPFAEIRRIFTGILDGLQAAHTAGIIHRDLKPGNIMLVDDGSGSTVPKIVDFGIAKSMQSNSEIQRLTQTGAVLGSPSYMSPEQCTSAKVDARTDIYAVGCMLFEAATGRLPFDADNALAVMAMHIADEVVAPSTVAAHPIPRAFDQIVLKCLSKEPADRYQTAAEVRHALHDVDVENVSQRGSARKTAVGTQNRSARSKVFIPGSFALLLIVCSAVYLLHPAFRPAEDPKVKVWRDFEDAVNGGNASLARQILEQNFIADLPNPKEQGRAARNLWNLSQMVFYGFPSVERAAFAKAVKSQVLRRPVKDVDVISDLVQNAGFTLDTATRKLADNHFEDRAFIGSLLFMRAAHPPQLRNAGPEVRRAADMALEYANKTGRADRILRVLIDTAKLNEADRARYQKLHAEIIANDNRLATRAIELGSFEGLEATRRLFEQSMSLGENRDIATGRKCVELMEKWLSTRPNAIPWIRAQITFDRGLIMHDDRDWESAESKFTEALNIYAKASQNDEFFARINHFTAMNESLLERRDDAITHYDTAYTGLRAGKNMWSLFAMQVELDVLAKRWEDRRDYKHAEKLRAVIRRNNDALEEYLGHNQNSDEFKIYHKSAEKLFAAYKERGEWNCASSVGTIVLEVGDKLHRPDLQKEALQWLVDSYSSLGKTRKAADSMERLVALKQKGQTPRHELIECKAKLTSFYYSTHQFEKIEPLAKEVIAEIGDDTTSVQQYGASVPIILAMMYVNQKRIPEARILFNKWEPIARDKNKGPGFTRNLENCKKMINASQ